jgi:hypothetical protein
MEQIEAEAYALIRAYEARHGRIEGCVVPPEVLLPYRSLRLVYFSEADRAEYRIPAGAIGALNPARRLVFLQEGIEVTGREWQTVGEELGHDVLHAKPAALRDQPNLDLDVPRQEPACALFYRTVDARFVDGKRERPWMSRKAAFFAACLQMPCDRYGPVAERRLAEALAARQNVEELLRAEPDAVAAFQEAALEAQRWGWDLGASSTSATTVADNDVVEDALDRLQDDHGGEVSKAAQRRRFVELGLVYDVADVAVGDDGGPLVGRFEFYLVSDRVKEVARRMLGG